MILYNWVKMYRSQKALEQSISTTSNNSPQSQFCSIVLNVYVCHNTSCIVYFGDYLSVLKSHVEL